MQISIDQEQGEVLRNVLEAQLKQLRFEIAHTDSRDFREMLHRRERVLETVLLELTEPPPQILS